MYSLDSDAGYMIRVTPVIPAAGEWVYTAYGPSHQIKKDGERVMFEGLEYKTRYAIGEEVPPAYSMRTKVTCRLLGGFHSRKHGGTDPALAAAKAACDQHLNQYGAI